jgi:hypothetical protein
VKLADLSLDDDVDLRLGEAWVTATLSGIVVTDEMARVMRLCYAIGYRDAMDEGPRFKLVRDHARRIARRLA